jgi:hypothetical protein
MSQSKELATPPAQFGCVTSSAQPLLFGALPRNSLLNLSISLQVTQE